MLGKDRAAFSFRYCNRRLVPVGRHGTSTKKYDNSGLSRAGELHALLKEVSLPSPDLTSGLISHQALCCRQETKALLRNHLQGATARICL